MIYNELFTKLIKPEKKVDGLVQRDEKWAALAEEVFHVMQVRKAWQEKEDTIVKQLKELSENKSSMGGNWVYLASQRKGNVDFTIVPELKGVDLDPYRKAPVTNWILRPMNVTEMEN